ncbi:MAG: fumarate hydratase C-terminal domain-containing protein, partial [Endomicrobiales bacterium]
RSPETLAAIQEHGAVYFAATGGVAALLAATVKTCEIVAFGDLGPEAIYRLSVRDFPLIVAIDSQGNTIYERTNTNV